MESSTSSGTDEKHHIDEHHAPTSGSAHSHPESIDGIKDVDAAFKYLNQHAGAIAEAEGINMAALRRKIDWRIVPIMFLCYTMQFIDKVLVNYAAVMGITTQLKLAGNDFSNVGSAFFIAYLIAEIPNGLILQKVSPSKWLALNVFLWGIATACTAASFNYGSLLAARIVLGVFEASIAPCLMLISSQYYTKSEQAPRFSFWYCGLGVGQIIGGIVSFAFQHISPTAALQGWQVMFIVIGIITCIIGVATYFILPDSPMSASFLTEVEKTALIKHVSINQTGIENHHFKFSQMLEVLIDPQIWLMTLMTILISVSSGVITTYSSTLIKTFGFSSMNSALLNMPSGIVSIASTLIVGFGVRHTSHRWAWLVACCCVGILGGGLMSFAPASNRAALLVGIYLVNAIVATLTIIYQWTIANCAGQTKRVVASALIAGSFSVGNIIGPQTFQAKDAPQYQPAKITVMATQAGGAVVAVALFLYYVWANKKRDKADAMVVIGEATTSEEELHRWEGQTDKENKSFRYVY